MGRVKSKNAANTCPKGWRGPVGDPTQDWNSTAKNIADHDENFRAACGRAGVLPTRRQASKWRRGIGSAFSCR